MPRVGITQFFRLRIKIGDEQRGKLIGNLFFLQQLIDIYKYLPQRQIVPYFRPYRRMNLADQQRRRTPLPEASAITTAIVPRRVLMKSEEPEPRPGSGTENAEK